MSTTTSEQDATAQNAPHVKKWQFKNFPTVADALSFAHSKNLKAGELSAVARNDKTVGMFYFD